MSYKLGLVRYEVYLNKEDMVTNLIQTMAVYCATVSDYRRLTHIIEIRWKKNLDDVRFKGS